MPKKPKNDDVFDEPTVEAPPPPAPKLDFQFEMPPARIPAPEPGGAVGGNWNEIPGEPATPVETPHGWCGGGKVRFTLCRTNPDQDAAGCVHYSKQLDQCTGPMPESLRQSALYCINYRSRKTDG